MTPLTDVTLCAADCAYPELAARALIKSMAACEFADAILFSDVTVPGPFRSVRIPPIRSRAAYGDFVLKRLAAHVTTPFVLIVQWDGWIVNPDVWSPDFKDYDYVGATWPWHKDGKTVGNGGFSLRSERLLRLTADPGFPTSGDLPEDHLICRVHRSSLEEGGRVRFAPEVVADRFSYERRAPDRLTFGFHGLFNMWRHAEDAEMTEVVNALNSDTMRSREVIELLLQYVAMRKIRLSTQIYSRMRTALTADALDLLIRKTLAPEMAEHCLTCCRRWAEGV